jgi:hypothetical protein
LSLSSSTPGRRAVTATLFGICEVLENVAIFIQTNGWLEKRLEVQFRDLTRKIMQKDEEIKKLNQALDFRRALVSGPKVEEPGKD